MLNLCNKFKLTLLLFFNLIFIICSVNGVEGQEARSLWFLNEYIDQIRQDWEVPGVAIAIVKDGQIVWTKGYGVTQVGGSTPVTEETMFAIGSCTKAFTSAALALLMEENKIHWDHRVVDYLDDFQLFDGNVTQQLTVRDLLSHQSGLSRGDLVWYGTKNSRQEVIRRLRHLKPSWGFRTRYGYQNIMFLTAGEIIPSITGLSWDDFIRERFFAPLGMTKTNTSINQFEESFSIAMPHIKVNEEVKSIPWRNIDNVGPAASINSNAIEMAQWLKLHLNAGSYNQKQLISTNSLMDMYQSQISIPVDPKVKFDYPTTNYLGYGLGWFLHDYQGYQVVEHGGAIDGMSALVAMIPEEGLGVVILTNMEHTLLTRVLKYEIFDHFLGMSHYDWNGYFLNAYMDMQSHSEAFQQESKQDHLLVTAPALDLKQYAGTYYDDLYGEARITFEQGQLKIDFLAFEGELNHWQYNTFQFDPSQSAPTQLSKWYVSFYSDQNGKVIGLNISELGDTVFTFIHK